MAKKATLRKLRAAPAAPKAAKPRKTNPQPAPAAPAEPTEVGKFLRTLGTGVGSFFGAPGMGNMAGAAVSRLLGHGDYEVKTNSLIQGGSGLNSTALVMGPDGKRGIRIQEREFIGVVYGSTDFRNVSFTINPANPTTFPWLSTIAQNFDEWRPDGIAFSFKTTSAAFNGVNQALGVVVGATDYDPADPPYASRLEMESSAYCVSGVASSDWVHLVECDPNERGRQVLKCSYSTAVPSGTSVMDYHLGTFQVASDGQSSNGQVLGELWVSYDITFFKKQLHSGQVGMSIGAASLHGSSAGFAPNDGFLLGSPANLITKYGNLNVRFLEDGGGFTLIGITTGYYRIIWKFSSSTDISGWENNTVTPINFSGTTNAVPVTDSMASDLEYFYAVNNSYTAVGQKARFGIGSVVMKITGLNPTFLFNDVAITGYTFSTSNIYVEQVPPPIALPLLA